MPLRWERVLGWLAQLALPVLLLPSACGLRQEGGGTDGSQENTEADAEAAGCALGSVAS